MRLHFAILVCGYQESTTKVRDLLTFVACASKLTVATGSRVPPSSHICKFEPAFWELYDIQPVAASLRRPSLMIGTEDIGINEHACRACKTTSQKGMRRRGLALRSEGVDPSRCVSTVHSVYNIGVLYGFFFGGVERSREKSHAHGFAPTIR
ncbi:uncharacterized protein BO97DRAFT_259441 [Aspergillus homomorphus CBS 101889]|uniref:Uncharacterized protein n=1 Tax=Aspergillus homomorphus (strain CBS 101889) TaxID=1450537 RepID=A0A395I3U6_ASPHC|nr:hypothetical protein BO97DRAFT_259441 [Aspergillus homomorphus CBS 101889]RAL14882.1 hypothetical protein BO97DRAFT_259441 [Aspergillus homomorphus CBS 101889]